MPTAQHTWRAQFQCRRLRRRCPSAASTVFPHGIRRAANSRQIRGDPARSFRLKSKRACTLLRLVKLRRYDCSRLGSPTQTVRSSSRRPVHRRRRGRSTVHIFNHYFCRSPSNADRVQLYPVRAYLLLLARLPIYYDVSTRRPFIITHYLHSTIKSTGTFFFFFFSSHLSIRQLHRA